VTVGILGGGQLGLMLAESLESLGEGALVLEPNPHSPCAGKVEVLPGALDDPKALADFFSRVDVATYDSENIPAAPLAPFAAKLAPSLTVLEVAQDRIREKTFLREQGVPTGAFAAVPPGEDVRAAAKRFGLPCIAKSARGGYDGKGQYLLTTDADVAALPVDAPFGWVLEEVLTLHTEVSCVVGRARDGATVAFPVFENLHHAHILDFTVLPARVSEAVQAEATQVATRIVKALDVVGLLTVEFFVASGRGGERKLLANEMAPRVHNSGHVTRKACDQSQFDVLAKLLTGKPVSAPRLKPGGWVMGQLLGEVWQAQGKDGGELDLSARTRFPEVLEVYGYGKQVRPKRKMGHFIVHAATAGEALTRAKAFREALMAKP